MNPETVSGLKIGNFGDGEGVAFALNAHLHFGTGEIKGGAIGPERAWTGEKC
jgi:hypothetical protein